jgi:hypothetical protein
MAKNNVLDKGEAEIALMALSICRSNRKGCKYGNTKCYNAACRIRIENRGCEPAKQAEKKWEKDQKFDWEFYYSGYLN